MAEPRTFEGGAESALNAADSIAGALRIVYQHLDSIETADRLWRESFDSDPDALAKVWPKIIKSVQQTKAALGIE